MFSDLPTRVIFLIFEVIIFIYFFIVFAKGRKDKGILRGRFHLSLLQCYLLLSCSQQALLTITLFHYSPHPLGSILLTLSKNPNKTKQETKFQTNKQWPHIQIIHKTH